MKPDNLMSQIIGYYKDKKENYPQKICLAIDSVIQNKDPSFAKQFAKINQEYYCLFFSNYFSSISRLKLQLESSYYYNLPTEEEKESFKGFIEYLQKFMSYYVERENSGQNILQEYKNFFLSSGNLLGDMAIQKIFVYTVKLVVKEYNRIHKLIKSKAKDEQAFKSDKQVSKQMSQETISVISELLRQVNIKGVKELKLLVSNQQMKIHFLLFQFDRAAACDKPAQEKNLLEISPQSDIITYYYYKGRITIFNSNFSEASKLLQQVLDKCPATEKGKIVTRQVLKYLIPVNIFLGKYAQNQVMEKYKLFEYIQLCKAVKQGNIKLLQSVIDQNRAIWIKRSLLILMDQLKVMAYRNLCKRVWLICNKIRKLQMSNFLTAFKFSHPENQQPDMSEVCCILANLIYLKLIGGRIYQNNEKNIRALSLNESPFSMVRPEEIDWKS